MYETRNPTFLWRITWIVPQTENTERFMQKMPLNFIWKVMSLNFGRRCNACSWWIRWTRCNNQSHQYHQMESHTGKTLYSGFTLWLNTLIVCDKSCAWLRIDGNTLYIVNHTSIHALHADSCQQCMKLAIPHFSDASHGSSYNLKAKKESCKRCL